MPAPNCSRPEAIGTGEVSLDGESVHYAIRRSCRARRVRLEICPESGLQVIIPRHSALRDVPRLLNEKSQWIRSKLEIYRRFQAARRNDGTVHYLGQPLKVLWSTGPFDSVSRHRDHVTVTASPSSNRSEVLERWLRNEARRVISRRLDALCRTTGITCSRFGIRSARTRFGSCSARGSLSFTWRLVMAPDPVIDYVVIHELLHIREMNHSRRFWGLVEKHCPGFREHRAWLKEHQMELVAPLPT